jgi:glycosyltransferase involved in cell wall biosynthesis
MLSLAAALERRGWQCEVDQLPKRRYVRRIVPRLAQVRAADVLILHRIKLSTAESWPLRRAARALAYDVDDAIYLGRPQRIGEAPDRSWFREYKFANTCAIADLVMVGNSTLAAVAGRKGRRVEVVPTPVDVTSYSGFDEADRNPSTLVWIGLPENVVYLDLVRPVLAALTAANPQFILRVVSSRFPDWDDVRVEQVPWTAAGETRELCTAGIGVMPLPDDDWTRGKCAFKLLQYMAAALPCVGSAVGANLEAVEQAVTGFLASSAQEWIDALRSLLGDPERARVMGEAGRERARRLYDVGVVTERAAGLVQELVGRTGPASPGRA